MQPHDKYLKWNSNMLIVTSSCKLTIRRIKGKKTNEWIFICTYFARYNSIFQRIYKTAFNAHIAFPQTDSDVQNASLAIYKKTHNLRPRYLHLWTIRTKLLNLQKKFNCYGILFVYDRWQPTVSIPSEESSLPTFTQSSHISMNPIRTLACIVWDTALPCQEAPHAAGQA